MKIATSIARAPFVIIALSLALPVFGQTDTELESDRYGERLGTVHFPASCEEAARDQAARGLALLHHMTYEGARAAFAAAAARDPECAMAYWGQAMSFIHPLWSDPPSEAEFEQGQALLEKARNRGQKTDWEDAYIAAVEGYYAPGWSRDEKDNLVNFEMGWSLVHGQFPEDPEAASFYALAHLANADLSDKSYERQEQAAELAREVLAVEPDHPGAHHYIIHAYDYPPLAEKALDVARSYSDIAPDVAHALHMPSHIFTRLGLWEESIDMNRRSADAALEQAQGEAIPFHYFHALDYLAYAHLQRADDQQAEQTLQEMRNQEGPLEDHGASAYALAAVPARLALERQRWDRAASLEARVPSNYPWDQAPGPAMEAITHFARALGAARSGNTQGAQQALDRLGELQVQLSDEYWANQVEIQQLAAKAWLAYQRSDQQKEKQQEALDTMREAAELEASTEKHPTTPGEVLPAQELLADMLLDMERYDEAQTEYDAALERSPNRFNSLYGLGRAAELAGDNNEALRYYGQLAELSASDAERERLEHAKQFIAEHS